MKILESDKRVRVWFCQNILVDTDPKGINYRINRKDNYYQKGR
jgi:hypothetical protein